MGALQIVCYPALFNGPSVAPGNLQLNNADFTSIIQTAVGSVNASVTIDPQCMNDFPGRFAANGVTADDLNGALSTLLAKVQTPNTIAIGLFLTDRFRAAPGQFGVMFDSKVGDVTFGPRLGCAVFLSAINGTLGNPLQTQVLQNFIAYTSLHEVGHAFNLWHIDDGYVMQPTPTPGATGTCDFDDCHKKYLARISDSTVNQDIIPGQSPFGTRPSDCPQDIADMAYEGPSETHAGLKLKIAFSHESFWAFEPIELDLTLSLVGAKQKRISVRDEIDPAYSSFQIWITTPRGERRRYRSDIRFCRPNGRRILIKGNPFTRDISMLTELGRNTFDVPGDYEVKVVMLSAKGKKIESNTAKCTLQRPKHGDKKWDLHWEALGNPMAQRLLRYKQTLPNQKAVDALVSLTKKTSPVTASLIHYSLGKAYFKATKSLVNQDQQLIGDARKLSVGHLAEALKFDDSNPHRKEVANNLIAKLS